MTLRYLAMHSRPETREKFGIIRSNWLIYKIGHPTQQDGAWGQNLGKVGIIRSNWLIYKIFPSKKSKVTAILRAPEQKVHNPQTQKRAKLTGRPNQ